MFSASTIVSLAFLPKAVLKFCDDPLNQQLPKVSALKALTNATSANILSSNKNLRPLNSLVSLGFVVFNTSPFSPYLTGNLPSSTQVPTPVGV